MSPNPTLVRNVYLDLGLFAKILTARTLVKSNTLIPARGPVGVLRVAESPLLCYDFIRGLRHAHARATEYLQNYDTDLTDSQRTVREAIAKICADYPDQYWLKQDESKKFPAAFHKALAQDGWLGICMPQQYGGSELGIAEAAAMMHTISESGGARKDGDEYILLGQKIGISTAQNAQKILIFVRTTQLDKVQNPSQGLSLFYTDLDLSAVEITEIPKMGRAAVGTNTLFDNWRVPASDMVGKENEGSKMILHGMNAERILIGAEALGLGYAALRKAAIHAGERKVFGHPIGKNQAIQHPLADSWMKLEAARLMLYHAARMYDQGYAGGEYANSAKYLVAEAAFQACERAVMVHGGMGYAKEYHVERYLCEVFIRESLLLVGR